ncbi:solute carrier family 66 member 2 isoform X3 [Salvelinus sp. IW2-2015]|uniref:solute carrier family 66 member 2 isoform X3 n=1 Tax=Salvelinus sp. IW2-2015 TaxID=2691554 RepID=UPI000CDFA2B5|nr:PQ-loop repeat-containing protein 1-like isoform X3 [Salvelinus alpinus]
MDIEVDIQEEDMEGSWTLLSWLASCVMVFGGALPYVPQYQEIQRSSNTEGFSTRVCLLLLIANILRIFFWIGKQFELTLLLQSVVMIITMLSMLHLCCNIQQANRVSTNQHHFTDLDLRYFWSWSAFEDYLLFCFAFTVLCAFLTLLLLDSVLFVEGLGSLAVLFEAMLGVPQLLQNFHNHSTRGMSTWTGETPKDILYPAADSMVNLDRLIPQQLSIEYHLLTCEKYTHCTFISVFL